mmetsp:Transcript_7527/g.10404  ORF Transcript_7527/g.10404 Transcript_7527/m.10404 type:complete len:89 (+) Transcript_7527:189-455(+)
MSLIAKGADPFKLVTPEGYPESALHRAAMKGNSRIVELFVKCKGNINVQNDLGDTPLPLDNCGLSKDERQEVYGYRMIPMKQLKEESH